MSIIGKGYFETGPGAWCSTKITVRETPDGEPIHELELHLPPAWDPSIFAWLFHFVLENVINHRTMPNGAGLGPDFPMASAEESDRLRSQKFWFVYEYGEIKAPPFAAAAHLSAEDLEALVFDKSRPGVVFPEDQEGIYGADESPSPDTWVPAWDGSPFLIDPTRTGQ